MNCADADAIIRDTKVVGSAGERAILRILDRIVDGGIHTLDHRAQLRIWPEAGLIAVGRYHPEALALLQRGIEGADAGATSGGVHDIGAGVVLRQAKFLALIRVLEIIRICNGDFDIRVDALGTGHIAHLIAHHRRNAEAADEADLASLAHERSPRTGEEGAFLLPEEEVGDVVRRDFGIDERELRIRILLGHFGQRIGEKEADADGDIAALGGIGEIAHVVRGSLALEHIEGHAELILRAHATLVGHVVEALIADTCSIGHQGGDNCVLRRSTQASQQRGRSDSSAAGDDELTSIHTAGKHCIVAPVTDVQGTVALHQAKLPDLAEGEEHRYDSKPFTSLANPRQRATRRAPGADPEDHMTEAPHTDGVAQNDVKANAPQDDASDRTSQRVLDFLPIVQAAQILILQRDGVIDPTAANAILRAIDTSRFHAIAAETPVWQAVQRRESAIEESLPSEIAGAAALGRTLTETIATAARLGWRRRATEIGTEALALRKELLTLAQAHAVTVMGAFVDHRAAAPTTLAHFLGGVIGGLESVWPRLIAAIDAVDRSPFGAGLIVGEAYGVDREAASRLLGFRAPIENTFDAASDVEDAVSLLEALAALAAVIRRFVGELLVWLRTDSASFFLDERWEVVPESAHPAHTIPMRLQEVELQARQVGSAVHAAVDLLRSQPYGPLGAAWNVFADTIGTTIDAAACVAGEATAAVRSALIVNRAYLANRAGRLYTTATDLSVFLMEYQGLNPAAAQRIAGLAVTRLKEQTLETAPITPDIIAAAAVLVIGQELKVEMETLGRYIAPRRYIERRDLLGSPKADRTRAWLDHVHACVTTHQQEIDARRDHWQCAENDIARSLAESVEAIEN